MNNSARYSQRLSNLHKSSKMVLALLSVLHCTFYKNSVLSFFEFYYVADCLVRMPYAVLSMHYTLLAYLERFRGYIKLLGGSNNRK